MTTFSFESTRIEGLKLITPFFMEDERGYFLKSVERGIFAENNLEADIYEDFESYSKKNVIRGMHFQTTKPQAKIVRAISGTIFDVAVDLRKGSKTFGQWEGFVLSENNRKSLFIPKGLAHGFLVRSDSALVSYKCIGQYLKEYDTGICWNDVDLNITWNVTNPMLSEKDSRLMSFKEYCTKYASE